MTVARADPESEKPKQKEYEPAPCFHCKERLVKQMCRTCETEFYEGHAKECPMHKYRGGEMTHHGHQGHLTD